MITYTLAKEMAEASFPYIQKKVAFDKYDKVWNYLSSSIGEDPMATDPQLVPTLEEVIEALGDINHDFNIYIEVRREGVSWSEVRVFGTLIGQEKGPTPLIAACNLWLSIHKK